MITANLKQIGDLVSKVKDPNHQGIFGNTLLHSIVEFENSFELVQKLISAGADVNMGNFFGITPLHCAVIYRNHSAFNALIQCGALINSKNYGGNTALHYSISNCMHPVLHQNFSNLVHHNHLPDKWIIGKLLLHENLDINTVNNRGETPLMWAVACKQSDVVKVLLEKTANVNISDCLQRTPLHIAISASEPNLDIIFELLVSGACIYCLDNKGDAPANVIIQRFLNPQSNKFVETFAKLIGLMHGIHGFTIPQLVGNSRVFLLLKRCTEEVQRMKDSYIVENISLFDILYKDLKKSGIKTSKIWVYKNIVETLISGDLSMYCDIILKRIPKFELCRILTHFIFSKNYLRISENVSCLYLFSNIIINNCLSKYLSKKDMFNVFVALFAENYAG